MSAASDAISRELAAELGRAEDPIAVAQAKRRALLALAPGLHDSIPEDVYHARVLGVASKTGFDYFAQSPAHYRAWSLGEMDRVGHAPMRLGKMTHAALLEPARFAAQYVIEPAWGPLRKTDDCSPEEAKANKTRRDAWKKEHAGATILSSGEGIAALGMVKKIATHPLAARLFDRGRSELTARWQWGRSGLECKARLDHYIEELRTIVDVKTCASASAEYVRRAVWTYRYDRQAAWYWQAAVSVGAPVENFVFVFVESAPPHEVALFSLEDEVMRAAGGDNLDALRDLSECLATDTWPGHPERIQTIGLPPWARRRAA